MKLIKLPSIVSIVMIFLAACGPKKQAENAVQSERADNAATRYVGALQTDAQIARDKVEKHNQAAEAMEAAQKEALETP